MLDFDGREPGLRHARKHLGWYLDCAAPHTPAALRQQILTSRSPEEAAALMDAAFDGDWSMQTPEAA